MDMKRLAPACAMTIVLLSSCVGPPSPRPAAPVPVPPPAKPSAPTAPVPAAWEDRPLTPGGWTYTQTGQVTTASFGPNGQVALRCDRTTRRISIERAGASTGPITIRTSNGAVTLPATAGSGTAPRITAIRAASDPVFDQIAYSRGKVAIETAGMPQLIVPPWAEVVRVIEDCRG